jgi:hypothetical protein
VAAGADIKTAAFGDRVDSFITASNKSAWGGIYALKDIKGRRIIWFFPSANSSVNDMALVYYGQIDAWSIWSGWTVYSSMYDPVSQNVYALLDSGKLVQLCTGTTDNGSNIAWYYETCYLDMRSYQEKRLLWHDLVVDRASGQYTFTVTTTLDGGRTTLASHTLTDTTTDGGTIETTGSKFTNHRIYEDAHCRFFSIKYSGGTLTGGTPKIIGHRAEVRMTGVG